MMGIGVVLQLVVFALVLNNMLAKHHVGGEQNCHGEKVLVMIKCHNSIKRGGPYVLPRPGDNCCTIVKASDTACICRILTDKDEITVDPKRLVKVADRCGKPVPAGNKCGSKFIILLFFLYKDSSIIVPLLSNHF
jgi:hypothetical protein